MSSLEASLTCTFCHLPFNHPKALACLHTFCKSCLGVHILKNTIAAPDGTSCVSCPVCQQICDLPANGIDGLQDNILMKTILAMINTKAKQICDPCTDDGQNKFANFCCTKCEDFMCEPCAITHKRTRGTKEHLVLDVGCMKELCRIVNQDEPHRPIINVRLIRKFGKEGKDLNHPIALTVNMADDVVIAQGNSSVDLFTANGEVKKSVDQSAFLPEGETNQVIAITTEGYLAVVTKQDIISTNTAGQTIIVGAQVCTVQSFTGRKINTCVVKTKNPEECKPYGVAVTTANHIIITDIGKHCIYVFDAEYKQIKSFGKRGSRGAKQFKSPYYVATNNDNDIIVSDYGNHCIKVFQFSNLSCKLIIGNNGNQPGQFMHPMGICADKFGNIFVADRDNHRIQMFDPKGQFLATILQETYDRGEDIRPLALAMTSNSNLVVLLTGVEGVEFSQVCIYQLRSTKIPLEQHKLQQEKLRKEAAKRKQEEEERKKREEEEEKRLHEKEDLIQGGEKKDPPEEVSSNKVEPFNDENSAIEKSFKSAEQKTVDDGPCSKEQPQINGERPKKSPANEDITEKPKKRKNSSKRRQRATETETTIDKEEPQGISKRPSVLPPIRGTPTPSTSTGVPGKRTVQPDVILQSIAESIIFDPDKCEAEKPKEGETAKSNPSSAGGSASSRRSSKSGEMLDKKTQVCVIL